MIDMNPGAAPPRPGFLRLWFREDDSNVRSGLQRPMSYR